MALDFFSIDGAGLEIENYIYMYHLQEFIVLPSFVDSVQENFQINWSTQTILGRSAPIYSFQNAGPRTLQVTFILHRDMMWQINKNVSNAKLTLNDDYIDVFLKDLQACVLPDYDGSSKAVNPPIIAMRIGNDIFIKGIITGTLGYTWMYPILENGKYSHLQISFSISEIDPYDARLVRKVGSYRNISTDLDYSNIYDVIDSPEEVAAEGNQQLILDEAEFRKLFKQITGTGDMNIAAQQYRIYLNDPEGYYVEYETGINMFFNELYRARQTSTVNQPSEEESKDYGKASDSTSSSSNSSTAPATIEADYGKDGTSSSNRNQGGGGFAGGGAGRR